MPKKIKQVVSKTEIVCVLDRSGSMNSMADEAIGGFNAFLEEQKKIDGKANITVCLFDHEYNLLYDGIDLKKAEPLTKETYVPRGTTALLDAIGRTVDAVTERIDKLSKKNKPGKIIMAILTDGAENASNDYSREEIRILLEKAQKEQNWDVFYLAANQDAFAVGSTIGIANGNCMAYAGDALGGTQKGYSDLSRSITGSRVKN